MQILHFHFPFGKFLHVIVLPTPEDQLFGFRGKSVVTREAGMWHDRLYFVQSHMWVCFCPPSYCIWHVGTVHVVRAFMINGAVLLSLLAEQACWSTFTSSRASPCRWNAGPPPASPGVPGTVPISGGGLSSAWACVSSQRKPSVSVPPEPRLKLRETSELRKTSKMRKTSKVCKTSNVPQRVFPVR